MTESDTDAALLETVEILSDGDLLRRLAEAEKELAEGGGVDLEELRASLDSKLVGEGDPNP